jgi:hypothetical protein
MPVSIQPIRYNPPSPPSPSPTNLRDFQAPSFDYARIDAALNNPLFERGQKLLETDYLNSPETKQLLENVDLQGKRAFDTLTSRAQALAGRRGLTGSSIEQFGVGEAGLNATRATLDARNQILLQATQRQQAARDLAVQALFGQAGAGLAGEYGLAQTGAQLTSDEIASLRNLRLGEQGIQLGRENISQAERANRRANNPLNLLIGGIGAGLPAAIGPF